ncbi:MAG: ImmA/IrrE family metallo-endopeptidase [Bacteroidota bacterium]
MTVKNSSDSYIEQLADAIAKLHDQAEDVLESVLLDEGIEVFYDDYGDSFDGMTFYDDHTFFIHMNTRRGNIANSPRGRFTLAHELGHYFIDNHRLGLINGLLTPHGSVSSNKPERTDRIEREADYFAACMLMPFSRFAKEIKDKKFNFQLLRSLQSRFNVSLTATAFRFKDVGNYPITIIYAVDHKIKWVFQSHDFPYKYLCEKYPIIPENTLMDKCFKKQSKSDMTIDVWAIEWFNYVSKEQLQRKFKEHCIIHENKALSVIW